MPDKDTLTGPRHRAIRSFVRRAGRITSGQQRALASLWPKFGINYTPQPAQPQQWFGNNNPLTVEIGFGTGDCLLELARLAPERNFLGIEVHEPGVGRLLMNADAAGLGNLKVSRHDAVEVLRHQIPDHCIDRFLIFFPDPWHKKRHNKRRLINGPFLDMLANKLGDRGRVHLATDWEEYATQMLELLEASPRYDNLNPDGGFSPRPADRPTTKFERRGQRLGHGTWDLLFVRR